MLTPDDDGGLLRAIPVHADAHHILDLVRGAVVSHAAGLHALRAAHALASLVTVALLAPHPEAELQRLREADAVLGLLRRELYPLYTAGLLPADGFDAIARAASACRRELGARISDTRRRAWARLCGIQPGASASSSLGTSDTNSSSSNHRRSLAASIASTGA
jgi:hypothetical protein